MNVWGWWRDAIAAAVRWQALFVVLVDVMGRLVGKKTKRARQNPKRSLSA